MSSCRLFIFAALLVAVGTCCAPVFADAPPREYRLKAAFILNFVQFTEWPAETFATQEDPLVVGLVGDDPFGGALDQVVRGKRINGRDLVYRHFRSTEAVGGCHILFVSTSERGRLGELVRKLQSGRQRVLLVSDIENFGAAGGVISFFTEGNKMRFEINVDAADRFGLRFSSKLLKLARIYRE
jgi:hypothetical protein